ncbi:hypothetical protein LJC13_00645 [Peptostreptococcaceae bacterium OttesenSCG-928-C18]|nr:hypothetical protein [Peptostreptococcaceae bacterium OttesenSCG-928-C18]
MEKKSNKKFIIVLVVLLVLIVWAVTVGFASGVFDNKSFIGEYIDEAPSEEFESSETVVDPNYYDKLSEEELEQISKEQEMVMKYFNEFFGKRGIDAEKQLDTMAEDYLRENIEDFTPEEIEMIKKNIIKEKEEKRELEKIMEEEKQD